MPILNNCVVFVLFEYLFILAHYCFMERLGPKILIFINFLRWIVGCPIDILKIYIRSFSERVRQMFLRSSARNCSPTPNQDCNNSPFLLSFSLILDLIQEYSLPPEEKQNIAVLTPVTSGLEYPDMLDHAILNMQLKRTH